MPTLLSLKELIAASKIKLVSVMVGPVRFSIVPSLDSCADTISKESSDAIAAGPNSTVQVTMLAEPLRTTEPPLLETVTDSGFGTVIVRG